MHRREFLKLGAVAGGTVLLGGTGRFGNLLAAPKEIPSVDPVSYTHLDVYKRQQFDSGARAAHEWRSLPLYL